MKREPSLPDRLTEQVMQTGVGEQPRIADGDAVVEQCVQHRSYPQSAGIESEQIIEDRTKGESLVSHCILPSIAPIGREYLYMISLVCQYSWGWRICDLKRKNVNLCAYIIPFEQTT